MGSDEGTYESFVLRTTSRSYFCSDRGETLEYQVETNGERDYYQLWLAEGTIALVRTLDSRDTENLVLWVEALAFYVCKMLEDSLQSAWH